MDREQQVKEVMEKLSSLSNNFRTDNLIFVDRHLQNQHRTLQQGIGRFIIDCLHSWKKAYKEGRYDMRNEAICILADKIISDYEYENFILPFI